MYQLLQKKIIKLQYNHVSNMLRWKNFYEKIPSIWDPFKTHFIIAHLIPNPSHTILPQIPIQIASLPNPQPINEKLSHRLQENSEKHEKEKRENFSILSKVLISFLKL